MAKPYTPTPCRGCGGPKRERRYKWDKPRYCEACELIARDKWMRVRVLCGSTELCHDVDSCLDCARIKKARQCEAAIRGAAKRAKNNPNWAKPVNADKFWQGKAHAAVTAAIKHGLLPSLKEGDYACTDCGGIAREYDHRDYGRPLDVDPVCVSCNRRRGTAIWPSASQFSFKRIA